MDTCPRIASIAQSEGRVSSTPSAQEHAEKVLSPVQRDHLIRSIVASQALEGITVSHEEVAQLLDEVFSEPLVKLR